MTALSAYDLRKSGPLPDVLEKKPNKSVRILLTENSKNEYSTPVKKQPSKSRIPAKIAFYLSAEETKLIQAIQGKHGIHKATDVLRMSLRRFAEAEGLRA